VASVLAQVDREITAGHISGYDSIYQFYRDPTHLSSDIGRFIAANTVYATFFHLSPVGLEVPAGFYTVNDVPSPLTTNIALRNQLQQIVWDVVSIDPRSGVGAVP